METQESEKILELKDQCKTSELTADEFEKVWDVSLKFYGHESNKTIEELLKETLGVDKIDNKYYICTMLIGLKIIHTKIKYL